MRPYLWPPTYLDEASSAHQPQTNLDYENLIKPILVNWRKEKK